MQEFRVDFRVRISGSDPEQVSTRPELYAFPNGHLQKFPARVAHNEKFLVISVTDDYYEFSSKPRVRHWCFYIGA